AGKASPPAEEYVACRLNVLLPSHDALPVIGVRALPSVGLQHRGVRLLDLQEERILVMVPLEEHDVTASANAAHADDLAGHVDEGIAVQQRLPVVAALG